MARAVRRRGGFPAKPRKNLQWAGGFFAAPVGVASGTVVVASMVGNAVLALLSQGTIMRTRGRLYMEPNTTGQDPQVHWGIGVVDDRAFLAGSGSTPLGTDLEDFLAFGMLNVGVLSATVDHAPTGALVEIDSKAMRRFDATDTVVLVLEGAVSGHTGNVYGYVDCLIKED